MFRDFYIKGYCNLGKEVFFIYDVILYVIIFIVLYRDIKIVCLIIMKNYLFFDKII